MSKEIAIVGAARTPIGAFLGSLASLPASRLGAVAVKAALERAGLKPEQIDEVFLGCVLQGGQGQAPARQAALYAGLPDKTPCTTVNKVCGSGLKAVISGAQAILAGDAEFVIAGGMESMSNAPYFTHAMRNGARMGNVEMKDLMIHDGLWDPYNDMHMGMCGEKCATDMGFSRGAQDEYSIESTKRAQKAQNDGAFKAEIAAVPVPQKKGDPVMVTEDEGPKNAKPEKIPTLKPVFKKDGTITAANASSINDGAAAVVLTTVERALRRTGLPILGPPHGLGPRGAQPGGVHHRPRRRHPQRARPHQAPDLRHRPLGDQRGLRRGRHGQQQDPRPQRGQGERARRRGGPRAPDRRQRLPGARHAALRDEGPRQEARPGQPLHRRRRRHRRHRRALS